MVTWPERRFMMKKMKKEYEKYWRIPREIKSDLKFDFCPRCSWWEIAIQTVGFFLLGFFILAIIEVLLEKEGISIQFKDSYVAGISFLAFLMAIRFKSIVLELISQLIVWPLLTTCVLSLLFFSFFPDYAPIFGLIVWPILFLSQVRSLIKSIKEHNEVAEYYQSDLLPKKEILSLFKKGRSVSDICALGRERVEKNSRGTETKEYEYEDNEDESFSGFDIPDFEPEENQEPEIDSKTDMPEFEPEADPEPEPDSEVKFSKFSRDFDFKDSKNL